ncbi:hypothetical protein V6C27_09525 [Peptococcaceae bacterium 1198_IL3148]
MKKFKLAFTVLAALLAVILYSVVFGLYCLMVGVFYLMQKPWSMLFGANKSKVKTVANSQPPLKQSSQTTVITRS